MSRLALPQFVRDVTDDPGPRGILVAGALALAAVGLVPRVLSPGLPNAQELIKDQPQSQDLFLILAFLGAATVILGGLVSDVFRRRELLLGSLAVMIVAPTMSILIDDGPVFYAAGALAVATSGVVLAFAIGSVALAYSGVARATALGIVYAAYGGASALAPILLTLLEVRVPAEGPGQPDGFAFETWLAYVVSAASAGLALWAARRWMPGLPGALPASRGLVTAVALWSISILALVVGLLGLLSPGAILVPATLVAAGALGLGTMSIRFRRTAEMVAALRLDRRALGAALSVGIVVGLAQTIPLLLLPVVFERVLGYGPIFGMLAIAPFVVALLVAGPVSGHLLQRFGPRGMMTAGTLVIGIGNIVLAGFLSLVGPETHYAAFVLPLVFIGAGFVLSTTVRTAIVFASTPRGLPSSAAAINEASVALGSRIGTVGGTLAVLSGAMRAAEERLAGRPDADRLVNEFRSALEALGTPRFEAVIASVENSTDAVVQSAYVTSYLDGVGLALLASGLIGVIGAIVAWLLTGQRDPLRTVFDLQDERTSPTDADAASGRLAS